MQLGHLSMSGRTQNSACLAKIAVLRRQTQLGTPAHFGQELDLAIANRETERARLWTIASLSNAARLSFTGQT